jgi:pullulanase
MVYGEPWDGGGTKADPATTAAVKSDTNPMGAGAFDDDFRNAIKGGEFGGFGHGQVQGTFEDAKIVAGLQGSSCTRNKTGNSALSIHYVECHDNYTLFDKLAMSYLNKTTFAGDLFAAIGADGLKAVKAQNKLAAAYVFLAQGTPFINGGQEFLRTKQGNHNSYSAEKPWTNDAGALNIDVCNGIDLSFATKYADVVATYKGLIALRKDFSAFRYAKTAKAETVSEGVTKYDVTADDGNFTVLFNATEKPASVSAITGKVVNVNGGVKLSGAYFGLGFNDISASAKKYTIADTETKVSTVPAKSFVILKK